MPNWCDNSVTLYHEDKSKIDALEEILKKHSHDYSGPERTEAEGVLFHLRPRPDAEEDNWYSWNVENWGTKWDISPMDWNRDDENTIWMSFDSAWSPPTALYEYLVTEEGWSITAEYQEPGIGFVGKFVDGYDECYEYDFEDEDWRDDIPEDLIDFAGLDQSYEDWKEWRDDESEDEEKVD